MGTFSVKAKSKNKSNVTKKTLQEEGLTAGQLKIIGAHQCLLYAAQTQ